MSDQLEARQPLWARFCSSSDSPDARHDVAQPGRRYERAREEVGKWQPLVKAHREAPTLSFLAARGDAGRPSTTAALVAVQVRGTKKELMIVYPSIKEE